MNQIRVPVVSVSGQPLSPTTPSKARKMLKSGVATPHRDKLGNFYIQMTREVGSIIPHETVVGIDPGKLYSGMGVQTPKATLWMGHLVLPFPYVRKAMITRKNLRKARRFRNTPQRKKRFLHRTGHKIPPSIKANREMEYRTVVELMRIYPITNIVVEMVKANGNKSFSPVMVGQKWQLERLHQLAPTETREGWQTAQMRKYLTLDKDSKKSNKKPATHAVDGVALATSHFVQYESYMKGTERGHEWHGMVEMTPAPFSILQRPQWFRRKLHVEKPGVGGIRKRHGGTMMTHGFRKGDFVEARKANKVVRGYVSGYSEKNGVLSVADANWKRIGQFTPSKIRLLHRTTRLLVQHQNMAFLPHLRFA